MIHCLAICLKIIPYGEIDTQELEQFLDLAAGESSWLMLSIWAFALAPEVPEAIQTVPVIMPEPTAARIKLTELDDGREQRVYGCHEVGPVELWSRRFVAATVLPTPTEQWCFHRKSKP